MLAQLIQDCVLEAKPSFFLRIGRRIWKCVPATWVRLPLFRAFGMYLHACVSRLAERTQSYGTFFFRNRPELQLIVRLTAKKDHDSKLNVAVLGCSKGADVYCVAYSIRSARPDINLSLCGIDISQEVLDFAQEGIYSIKRRRYASAIDLGSLSEEEKINWNTYRDQPNLHSSIFERMSEHEFKEMFDVEGNHAKVKSWLKRGIIWQRKDVCEPDLPNILGLQDIVIANRFLCHMLPLGAEHCLRNIARLVKPGGYLFVAGVDLGIRTRVAEEMGWKPVRDLMRDMHEGDVSVLDGWPLEYWALEPFQAKRRDARIRYASVFQLDV
jgi:chemotaxis methyl-accepting protein methylase